MSGGFRVITYRAPVSIQISFHQLGKKKTISNFSTRFMKSIPIFLRKLGQNFDYDKKDTFICISFASCNGICTTIWRNVDSYRAE